MVPFWLHAVNYKTERQVVLSEVRTFIQERKKVMKNITQQYNHIHLSHQIMFYEECICYTQLINMLTLSQLRFPC